MSRYDSMFRRLELERRSAFVPFTVLGYPNLGQSRRLIDALVESGADALELGVPFSDPLADGPTIQRAMTTALEAGLTPDDCFTLLGQLRVVYPQLPVGLLVYANLVFSQGPASFFAKCFKSGVDSVLIADVPVEEADEFRKAALDNGVGLVFLCPPNIDANRLERISKFGFGYTYLLSRAGVTGTDVAPGIPVNDLIQQLNTNHAPPVLMGFGVSRPEHVRAAIKAGARGVICGSAIIEHFQGDQIGFEDSIERLKSFCTEMVKACRSKSASLTD